MITFLDEIVEAVVETLEEIGRIFGLDHLVEPLIRECTTEPIESPSFPVELIEHGGTEL
jgi:hypothetical protein